MYGNIRVAMEDVTVLVDYTVRKFCLQYVSQKNRHIHVLFLFIKPLGKKKKKKENLLVY